MSEDQDYASILNTSWSEIPEVQLLPSGSWKMRCRGATHMPPKTADQSPQVAFVYEAIEPMEDVDDDALQALGSDYNYEDNRIFSRFWFKTGADKQNVRNHIAKHGIDPNDYSVSESLKAVKGRDVIAVVGTETYKSKSGEMITQNVIKAFSAYEE